jgi:hypothetical protein
MMREGAIQSNNPKQKVHRFHSSKITSTIFCVKYFDCCGHCSKNEREEGLRHAFSDGGGGQLVSSR